MLFAECDYIAIWFLKQCPDIKSNPGPAGRPSYKVEINFRNPLAEIETIKDFCSQEDLKANVRIFATNLFNISSGYKEECSQTENKPIEVANEATVRLERWKLICLFSNIWSQIAPQDQVKMLFLFYNDLEFSHQRVFFFGDIPLMVNFKIQQMQMINLHKTLRPQDC